MPVRFVRLLTCLLGLLIAEPHAGFAQERRSPSILEFLGIKPTKPKVQIKKPQPKVRSTTKKIAKKSSGRKRPAEIQSDGIRQPNAAGSTAANVVGEKLPEAKIVLTIGDFMADGVSEGLETAFEADEAIKIINRANGSSGFVRDDFYSWTEAVPSIVAEIKPSAILVMIGTNDRQQLRLNGNREAVMSPVWRTEYERRVNGFSSALKATGVPVVWVGMPPFKQASMSADMLAFNDIYRQAATSANGQFIDIWEAFLDENGAFSINGFDHIGQPARLRASDGINLTSAGKRKIAFFTEKPLRDILGGALPAQTVLPGGFDPFLLPGPKKPLAQPIAKIVRTQPISLFDPAFDGGGELLGSKMPVKSDAQDLPATKLYREGIAPLDVPSRMN